MSSSGIGTAFVLILLTVWPVLAVVAGLQAWQRWRRP